jgi:hypothetical protein
MRVVVNAQRCAILEDNAPGTFYLYREQIGWILEPADFKFLPIKRARLDRAAVVVWRELALPVEATNPCPRAACESCGNRPAALRQTFSRALWIGLWSSLCPLRKPRQLA